MSSNRSRSEITTPDQGLGWRRRWPASHDISPSGLASGLLLTVSHSLFHARTSTHTDRYSDTSTLTATSSQSCQLIWVFLNRVESGTNNNSVSSQPPRHTRLPFLFGPTTTSLPTGRLFLSLSLFLSDLTLALWLSARERFFFLPLSTERNWRGRSLSTRCVRVGACVSLLLLLPGAARCECVCVWRA